MPLINCKTYLELNWIKDCIWSSVGDSAKFEITDDKLPFPIVTLSTKHSVNLTKKWSERFKWSVYRNSYQTKPAKVIEKVKNLYELLNASFQGVRRLFVLAYFIVEDTNADDEADIKDKNSIFFQEDRLKITTYWLMEGIFMINQ